MRYIRHSLPARAELALAVRIAGSGTVVAVGPGIVVEVGAGVGTVVAAVVGTVLHPAPSRAVEWFVLL